MYLEKDLMILYALTSTHVGSDDNLNYIDLPIQREKHTTFPMIESSSLKGCIKRSMGYNDEVFKIMGSDNNGDIPSLVSFSDARILFFPVKSAKGIFAYVTCPFVIQRFISDCKIVDIKDFCDIKYDMGDDCNCNAYSDKVIVIDNLKVILDEYVFEYKYNTDFNNFIDKIKDKLPKNYIPFDFEKRVVLISDNDFTYFTNHSTEVVTRIKIPRIVEKDDNALFTQENLPPETILYSLLFFSDSDKCVKDKFNSLFKEKIFQIGGDATLGKGLFCKSMWDGGVNNE